MFQYLPRRLLCKVIPRLILRKLTEFIVSIVLLVITAAVIIAYAYKYRLERKLWMLSILSFMAISLFGIDLV
jgi:hypothetical protein